MCKDAENKGIDLYFGLKSCTDLTFTYPGLKAGVMQRFPEPGL